VIAAHKDHSQRVTLRCQLKRGDVFKCGCRCGKWDEATRLLSVMGYLCRALVPRRVPLKAFLLIWTITCISVNPAVTPGARPRTVISQPFCGADKIQVTSPFGGLEHYFKTPFCCVYALLQVWTNMSHDLYPTQIAYYLTIYTAYFFYQSQPWNCTSSWLLSTCSAPLLCLLICL